MAKSNLSLLAYFLLVKSPLDTHTHIPLSYTLPFAIAVQAAGGQSNDHLQCDSGALPSFRFFE